MKLSTLLKTLHTAPQRERLPFRRLVLEWLEDRLVPSIPDGTVLVCTGPSSFSSQDQSSFPIGIIGVNPTTGAQFPVSMNSSQNGALFTLPTYAIEAPDGQLYVTDLQAFGTGAILRVDPNTGQQFLVAKGQLINGPNALAWVNGFLYVANEADGLGSVHTIVQVDPNTGAQKLITDGNNGQPGFTVPTGMAAAPGDNLFVCDEPGGYNGPQPGGIWEVNLSTGQQTLITWGNLINHPIDITPDLNGNLMVIANVVADTSTQRARIIRVNPTIPDSTGLSNQTLVYTENAPYPLDGITEDLNTGIVFAGSISYSTNPAQLLALDPSTQTQTTLATGGLLSLVEGMRVYHPVTQTAATTTSVAPSINPSTFGQTVTFTATVSAQNPNSGTATGTVQFQIDGNNIGNPVAIATSNGVATASLSTSTLPAGTHAITASYSGDSNFNGSSGSLSGGQIVNQASTLTVVATSGSPSLSGDLVIFTASVTVQSPGTGTPTGTVQFQIDGTDAGNPVSVSSSGGVAVASYSTNALSPGTHTVIALYSGDSNFAGSTGLLASGQVVNNQIGSSSTVVTSSANPSVYGQSVTFTASISGSGTGMPTGAVQFTIDGNSVGGPVSVSRSVGMTTASFSTSTLGIGTHTVTATYSGDGAFTGSTGTLVQPVSKAATSVQANSSASSVASGQSVTLTATATAAAPGSGTPTGTVDFYDTTTATDLGRAPLSSGNASLTLSNLPIGNNTITLSYSGDSNFLASNTTMAVLVNPQVLVNPSVLILDPTADGALTVSGNATINVTGSVVVDSNSNSALTVNGNAALTAANIQVVGNVKESGHSTLSPAPVTGAAALADPLANLAPPSTSGLTNYGAAKITGHDTETLQPGIYSEITISGNASVTLSPGVYVIEGGGFTVSGNAGVTGTGVLIYNTGSNYPSPGGKYGAIKLSGNSTVTLSAATTGVYAGIAIDQDRNNTQTVDIGSDISLASGLLYAPKASVVLSGGAQFTGRLDVDELTLSGNAMDNGASGPGGGGLSAGLDLSGADPQQSSVSAATPLMNGPAIPQTETLSESPLPQSLTRAEVQESIDYLFANSLDPSADLWLPNA